MTRDGESVARIAAPGTPRVWEGTAGALVRDAAESSRKVIALGFLDDTRLAVAFSDGRLCVVDVVRKSALVNVALLDRGAWVAIAADGTWDAHGESAAVQWAWNTDQRAYRDVHVLDPAGRRPGLLAAIIARGEREASASRPSRPSPRAPRSPARPGARASRASSRR